MPDMRDAYNEHAANWTLQLFDMVAYRHVLPRLAAMGLERRRWIINAVSMYALSGADFDHLDDRLAFLRDMCANEKEKEVVDILESNIRHDGESACISFGPTGASLAEQAQFGMCDVSRRYIVNFVWKLFNRAECCRVLSCLAEFRTARFTATLDAIGAYAWNNIRHDDWTYLMAYLCSMDLSDAEVKVLDYLHIFPWYNNVTRCPFGGDASPDTWVSMDASRRYVADLASGLFDETGYRRVLQRLVMMNQVTRVFALDAVRMYTLSRVGYCDYMCLVAYLHSMELRDAEVGVFDGLRFPSREITSPCVEFSRPPIFWSPISWPLMDGIPGAWADMCGASKTYVADLTSKLFNEAGCRDVLSCLVAMKCGMSYGALCAIAMYAKGCIWRNELTYLMAYLCGLGLGEAEVAILSQLYSLSERVALETGAFVRFDGFGKVDDSCAFEGDAVNLVDGLFNTGGCRHVLSRLAEMEPEMRAKTIQAIKAYVSGRVTRDIWAYLIAYLYSINLSEAEVEILGWFHQGW
ncbi:MAG: hypothetical protein LBF26_00425, partial [Puniceicoccales bacterium]|nr:hypothetical protein [Puniceicoccales bacterium]